MKRREGGAGTGTCGCGSQLHPRADPGTTPSATTGPPWVRAPWNAKAEKAGGALDRRVSSSGVCSGAPHPLALGERKKRRANPKPDQTWVRQSVGFSHVGYGGRKRKCSSHLRNDMIEPTRTSRREKMGRL